MTYRVLFTPAAEKLVQDILDLRVRQKVLDRATALRDDPELQGKALTDELTGFRSVRAVGQRYRIIYRVERGRVIVVVVAVGLRREGSRDDVYALAERMVRLGLVDPGSL